LRRSEEVQDRTWRWAHRCRRCVNGRGQESVEWLEANRAQLLAEDKEAQKNAPQVLKDSIKAGAVPPKPSQSRSFSTYARRNQELSEHNDNPFDDALIANTNFGTQELAGPATPVTAAPVGHKFGLPALPLPSNAHKDYRYDPVVRQFTNLMMLHGKLSVAQRNMSTILTHLRTQSPPNYNPSRPLLPGARKFCS
jgi:small subunit ribosomal protein S7